MKITEFVSEDWQKTNRKDKTSGMSRKAVKAYRRENPGSKLQTAVTTKPSKLKKGSKSAKRRKSFCARMRGMKKSRTSAKTARNPNSNINKALRRWNCESIEQMQELVMIAEQKIATLRQGMTKGMKSNHEAFKVQEARKPDVNFDIEDIKRLEQIKDLATLKTQAMALIAKPSAKPMRPEKVEWFRSSLERMNSPMKVIKLMYDLMLSGEGHQVIGSRGSMNPNSYRSRFGEQGVAEGTEDFEVRLDGKTVPGPFNDFDHARNKASKLISYQKGEVAEVYVNGKLKMRLKLNTPHQHFDEHTAA